MEQTESEPKKTTYNDTISKMMFGFGDSEKPNPDTVRAVEDTVLKYLRDLLHEADKIAALRGDQPISVEDILFLFRHNRKQMHRFIKYMEYKYVTLSTTDYSDNYEEADKTKVKVKKFQKLVSFVQYIDETGELTRFNEEDELKLERKIRASEISLSMHKNTYKEYSKARQISFSSRNQTMNKFNDWINPKCELWLSKSVIELLQVLAYACVGYIVDIALIVREESKRLSHDPFHQLSGNYYNPGMFSAPHTSDKITLGRLPLTLREVHEAIRRFYSPQVGFMNFSHKSKAQKRKLMY